MVTVGGVADQLDGEKNKNKKKTRQTTPKILESFIFLGSLGRRIEFYFALQNFRFYQPSRGTVQGRTSAAIISTMARRGKFITFEGLDGTGKSTQLRKLAAALRASGYKVIETREPGGTATGEKIRRVLLDSATGSLSPLAEMALMFASRAQHIAEVIEPALDHGQIVLCDRFTDSTEAYQGSGRKLGSEAVLELHRVLCGDLQPDLTILLDSDPAMSLGRARRRNRQSADWANKGASKNVDENRFEQQNRSFFSRVREGYLAIAAREPQRVVAVDARGTPAQTHWRIMDVVGRKLRLSARNAKFHHGL